MFTTMTDNPVLNYSVLFAFENTKYPSASPDVHSTSGTWEFIDEDELANEMTVYYSKTNSYIQASDTNADDFERLYQCFLS